MKLIYLGAGVVIGGAVMILFSHHGMASPVVSALGMVVTISGFAVYVVGRLVYWRRIKADRQSDTTSDEEG